ncbi:hypothetical protein JQX13_00535 [Archangium violaceum]|uniref:hypothetical protein n=1 Tax=Archangium violaceum TaxID=83451 RepID=UPI00193BC526|nr:hypothetical protein [Archangium violaceum]QRK08711.1 hypothetical protein JQX13_00535 [Archangium violaceum]
MKEPAKERGSGAPPGPEEPLEGVQSEEGRSAESDAVPDEQIEGRAMDTITDGDGNYLEPPD